MSKIYFMSLALLTTIVRVAAADAPAEGAAIHAVVDEQYRTPLHRAARDGNVEAVRRLLQSGAQVHALDKNGNPPLLYARKPEVIRLLLEHGADPDAQNNLGNTLMHNSVFYPPVIALLVERGADVNARDSQQSTPLHLAAAVPSHRAWFARWRKHPMNAGEPIAKGADVNAQDRQGRTPLHIAAQAGRTETVALLLQHGVQTRLNDKQGHTPLAMAEAQLARADQRHTPVFQEIVELIGREP